MSHTKLARFKDLVGDSKIFLKSNWRKIIFYFLPIQIIILVSVVVLDLIPEDVDTALITIISIFFGLLSVLGAILLNLAVAGAPLILKDIENETHHIKRITWYKNVLKNVVPMAWIGILVSLLNISFITSIFLLGLIIFSIPSVIAGILLSFGFENVAFTFQSVFVNNTVVGTMMIVIVVGIIVSSVAFFINSYFSIYAFLIEGRKGIDAITTSFLSVARRRTKIFWRVFGIWVITLTPFFILVFPIQAKIIYDGLRLMAIEVFLLQIPPAWPEVPTNILVIKDILSTIVSIISLPILSVLSYFLWKDVNTTSGNFEENKYNKTRKWIKIGVWAGTLILVILVTFSIIATLSFGTYK